MTARDDSSLERNAPEAWPRGERSPGSPPAAYGDVVRRLVREWKRIAVTAGCAGALALAVSFVLPKAYTASASFVPEQQAGAALPASLAGLAGQLGIRTSSSGASPEFYARLLNTRQLLTAVVTDSLDATTLVRYYGVAGRADSVDEAIRHLKRDYSVSVDAVTGIVRVDVELHSPRLAYSVAGYFLRLVDRFNNVIRRPVARERREFIQQRLDSVQAQLTAAENQLKTFLTSNRIVTNSPTLQFEQARLQRRVTVVQDLYMALDRDLQQARIDEVNETPVVSVVDPPVIPERPTSPRRAVLVLVALVLGAGGAMAWSLWSTRRQRAA